MQIQTASFLVAITSLVALQTQSAAAQPVAAQPANCEAPAYSARIAEAAVAARAEVQAKIAGALADSASAQLGDKPTVKGSIDAHYAISAAGGLAKDAYTDTARSYFCFLRTAAKGDPAKIAIIDQQALQFRNTLNKYFDAGVWQVDAIDRRSKIGDDIVAKAAQPAAAALLDQAFVDKAIPKYDFDTVKLAQITGDWTVGKSATINACAGIVKRSIRRVQPNVLASLQNVRQTVIDWMSGSRVNAEMDLWDYASSQMDDQLSNAQAREALDITPPMIVCLQNERDAAAQVAAKAKTPSASPAVTPPGS